ncbi:MAG: hypothetical protein ABIJ59_04980 [Pseudomonadota bacterium]
MKLRTIGLFIFSLYLMLVMGCSNATMAPMPEYLLGTWGNQTHRFEERYIQFNKTDLIFGTGAEAPTIFKIKKITENRKDKHIEWTFFCSTRQNFAMNIVLFYTNNADGAYFILSNNRDIKWTKSQE